MKLLACLFALVSAATTPLASADSAIWKANPLNGTWTRPANWTPRTVPNDERDDATFGVSTKTALTTNGSIYLHNLTFEPGASAYTIMLLHDAHLFIDGNVVNNSGVTQNLTTQNVTRSNGSILLVGSATVTGDCVFTAHAGAQDVGATIYLSDRANAGDGTYINEGAAQQGVFGASTAFFRESSAGHGTFQFLGGLAKYANGAHVFFNESADAGTATLTAEGATVPGAFGGGIYFVSGHAADSILVANAGSNGGAGGGIGFYTAATGDNAQVKIYGNATFSVYLSGGLDALSIGSLEGDGVATLNGTGLTVGANGLSTTFSGVLTDSTSYPPGALTKIGGGTFILGGANTYRGLTAVDDGVLRVVNAVGLGTGTGAVAVNAGTLGGGGTIAGAVTVGTGSGTGAFLQPSVGVSQPVTLVLQSDVTFKADSTYTYKLSTQKATGDQVVANGITIESGAQFTFTALANKRLAAGSVFTVISNTSATPISGTFANLADGSTLTAGRDKLLVSYSGGDGNDLTLTVQ